jgi:TRAP-type mannitol/chloroaromatic compound transport system substrate-binding protein
MELEATNQLMIGKKPWATVLLEEIIKALRVALEQVLDEEAAQSGQFKKILTNWRAFRANQHRWFSIADTRAEFAVYRSEAR